MRIRAEEPSDASAIDALLTSAFGRADEALLVRSLRADGCWIPDLSLVALTAANDVIGHVALTRATVDTEAVLALAPLAVAPQHQRQGVGCALVEEALSRARSLHERSVVVLGDPAYYARFGFRPAREDGITGPFGDVDAFQSLVLDPPGPRGAMRYAAPFGIDG